MTTEARIAANRANAQKSTGPKTAEGKRISARNALKHGFRAKLILDSCILVDHEGPRPFAALLKDLVEHLQPVGPLEEFCVETIATCQWRLRRVLGEENNQIDELHAGVDDAQAYDQLDRAPYPKLPIYPYLPKPEALMPLVRYERHISRERRLALRELDTLQSIRLARDPTPAPDPASDNEEKMPNEKMPNEPNPASPNSLDPSHPTHSGSSPASAPSTPDLPRSLCVVPLPGACVPTARPTSKNAMVWSQCDIPSSGACVPLAGSFHRPWQLRQSLSTPQSVQRGAFALSGRTAVDEGPDTVMPAKAGIQSLVRVGKVWIPARGGNGDAKEGSVGHERISPAVQLPIRLPSAPLEVSVSHPLTPALRACRHPSVPPSVRCLTLHAESL